MPACESPADHQRDGTTVELEWQSGCAVSVGDLHWIMRFTRRWFLVNHIHTLLKKSKFLVPCSDNTMKPLKTLSCSLDDRSEEVAQSFASSCALGKVVS
jgi:hypothetical protein